MDFVALAYMKKMISANPLLREPILVDKSLMAESGGKLDAASLSIWSSASTVTGNSPPNPVS
jgi:hypothetical protein